MASHGSGRPTRALPALLLLLGLFSSAAVAGPVRPIGASGAQVTVPDGWTVAVEDGGATFSVAREEPAATLSFVAVPEAQLGAALDEVQKMLDAMFTRLKLAPPEESTLNGIRCLVTEGTGDLDGNTVEIGLLALWPSPGQAVVVFGVAEKSESPKARQGIEAMFKSIVRVPAPIAPPGAPASAPAKPAPTPAKP